MSDELRQTGQQALERAAADLAAARAETALLREALEKCRDLFTEIRGDWSDPRSECREGWRIIDEALDSTSAAALSYQREVEERVRREFAEQVANFYPPCGEPADLSAREIASNAARALADAPREPQEQKEPSE
jgi:hypothetical protein